MLVVQKVEDEPEFALAFRWIQVGVIAALEVATKRMEKVLRSDSSGIKVKRAQLSLLSSVQMFVFGF